jgi:hypothetical protein
MELTEAVAKKVLETIDAGLVSGLGKPIPGQMCVEAAVNFALGQPHGDQPMCVGYAVRSYKIRLNDARWSSNEARTKGMRRVGVAQLGSDEIDQREFAKEVAFQGIKQILPIALRAAGSVIPAHKDALETAAVACEACIDLESALSASREARSVALSARADAYAAAADAADAYAADADAADAADAYAAYAYAAYADAAYAAYAYAAYAYAAYAYAAYAADAAAADAADAYAARDKILSLAAEIGVQALIKLKCKGCEWLALCDAADVQP